MPESWYPMLRDKPTPEQLEAGRMARHHGAHVIIVGCWIWAEFESKPTAEIRTKMKELGFRWNHKRLQWQLPPADYGRARGSKLETDKLLYQFEVSPI